MAAPVRANSFPAQSLIIPTQASFQDACGMVSTYGLVYSVLRANDGLRASKPVTGTGSFSTPITIHWVYSTIKKSPNRCVPTNLDTVFTGKTKLSSGGTISDTAWNDGCDITLTNSSGVPATLVNNSNTASSADGNIVTIDTTTDFGNALAFPNYQQHPTGSEKLRTLQYEGGAFVISASDAPGFLDLLSGKSIAQDASGNTINFSAFKTNGSSNCSTGTTNNNGNTIAVFTSNPAQANVHQVNIHRAQVPFTADDNARMNGAPPKIGLLQSVDHDFANESGNSVLTGLSRGGADPFTGKPIVGTPTGIKGTQLRFYLASAGLDFPQAGGCPPNGYNDPTVNTYDAVTAGFCQGGSSPKPAAGQIYDNLDARDFNSGLINGTTGGKPNYTVIWAPHWEGRPWQTVTSGSKQTAGCDASCIAGAQAALATFLDDTSSRRGFLGECATVGFMEGAVNDIEKLTYNTAVCTPGYQTFPTVDPNTLSPGCFPNERFVNNINATESLTCTKAGSVCAAAGTGNAQGPLGLTHDASNSATVSQRLNNCTDPSNSSAPCIQYGNPSSAFSQIGDYRWFSYSGGVGNYFPAPNSMYTPGTQRLLYTVGTYNKTTLANDPASLAIADNVSLVQRGNDNKKATMIYLAGHNYTPDIAGTRIALNTLLALGLVLDTKESAFVGPTIFGDNLVVPTYNRITNASNSIPSSYITFTPGTVTSPGPIKDWLFPYHTGTLHVDSLTQVAANGGTSTPYNQNQLFQQAMPDPGSRNVFTYLAGHVSTTPGELQASALPTNGGRGVAQVGWTPVKFGAATLDLGATGFIDKYHISQTGSPAYAGMVAGANKISDLQEALELTVTKSDLNSDQGLLEQTVINAKLALPSEINNAKWLIQMVRGYCYPTAPLTNFTPAQADCAQTGASNVSQLGGIVHSQPAVVPASPLIPDQPTGNHRPTVVYVGALDGQLHAFYMPSDGLDAGYKGPATALTDANADASGAFTVTPSATFAIPKSGTELWSFIPPGQLPFLQNNNAQVDSSPAVTDVFGDFDGTGIRTWRTVLVASAGGSNREIFALDVTNPLKPVLLWDIQSSFDASLPYAPSVLADNDLGIADNAEAFNWQNRCRAADLSAGTCKPTKYLLPPDTTDQGRSFSGLFNYSHLGASQSVSTGVLRRSNAPVYGAFVATNEAGGHGIYVFGIDLVTGAKLWEWNNPYDREAYNPTTGSPKLPNKYAGTGNSPPSGVAVISRSLDDQVNLVYAGDDEGSMWELNAEDGINTTAYSSALNCSNTTDCNYSLSQAYGYASDLFGSANADTPQPVSTLPTVFTVRSDVPASGIFNKYVGQAMLAYGTAGTDAVASITPQVSGAIHLIPLSPLARDTAADLSGTSGSTRTTHAIAKGVDYEAGVSKGTVSPTTFEYPKALTNGERVYGDISVDQNGRLFFGTTTGSITDIDSRGSLSGNIYQIDTASTTANAALSTMKLTSAAIGGVGGNVAIGKNASGQQVMVVSTDKDLQVPKATTGSGLSTQASTQTTGGILGWLIRVTGRE